MRPGPGIIVAPLVAAIVAWPGLAAALEHPPTLPEEAGCERWLGGASANDPSIRLNLILCNKDGAVTGHVQWSSLESGWNVREIAGTISGNQVTLRDVRITEERPQPGWRFCTIDHWDLARTGDRLEGTYDSAACDDHATVWFEKMPDRAEGGSGGGSGSNRVQPAPTVIPPNPGPPPTPRDPPRKTSGGSCRCDASEPDPGAALLLVAFVVVTRRRYRGIAPAM